MFGYFLISLIIIEIKINHDVPRNFYIYYSVDESNILCDYSLFFTTSFYISEEKKSLRLDNHVIFFMHRTYTQEPE